ncbi:hypothetical protein [Plantactinospora sonchi]|uniref:Uncharacterized protein n=1 Tax=Plantactinospora sonchi TaxID=1544735 RepID=A0ABU7RRD4_9ACTN
MTSDVHLTRPTGRRRVSGHGAAYGAAVLVTLGAFGPYTTQPGIRTEQIAVYSLLLVGILSGRRLRITPVGALIAALLVVELLIAAVGVAGPTRIILTSIESRSGLAGLDNLLLPIAALALALMLAASGAEPRRLIQLVCTVLIVAMCVNTALSVVSMTQDITPLLEIFWGNDATGQSVAERASGMGRLTGIFNQPAEGGALYSLALLGAIYRYRDRMVILVCTGTLLTIGGLLTVSKIFLMIGLPLALWHLVRSFGIVGPRLWALPGALLLVVSASQYGLLPAWDGVGYLTRLFRPSDSGSDLIGFYTAGRLGDAPSHLYVWDIVASASPWFGFGAGGVAAAYDNGWIEALAIAGLVGAFIYTAVIGCLVLAWFTRQAAMDRATSRFASGLIIVLVGASLGLPALTANRVATIAWLLIGLLLLTPVPLRRTVPPTADRPVRSETPATSDGAAGGPDRNGVRTGAGSRHSIQPVKAT